MVNFNVYQIMEQARGRGRRRQRTGRIRHAVAAAARARALPKDCPVLNELHGAAIAQSLENNLPMAVDTLVWRAITASLQADEGQDQAIHDQEQARLEEQPFPEEPPIQGRTVQDLHGIIARRLQQNLHGLIHSAVMSALHPDQSQGQLKQDQERPKEEEQPKEEKQPKEEEQPPQEEQPTPEDQSNPKEQLSPKEHPNV